MPQPPATPPEKDRADRHAAGEVRTPPESALKPVTDAVVAAAVKGVAALATTAGLVTFVAVTGGAVTWMRLYTAQLPADRALEVIPQQDLVQVGAVSLALFVVLGLVAVAGVYAADPAGRQTDDMRHGLAILVTVEIIVAIVLADADPWRKWVGIGLCAAVGGLGVAGALLAPRPPRTDDDDEDTLPGPERRPARQPSWLTRLRPSPESKAGRLAAYLAGWERLKPTIPEIDAAIELKRRGIGTGKPRRRYRRRLSPLAVAASAVTAVALAAVYFWLLFPAEKWVAAAALLASVLAGGCFGVARASGDRFWPYGIAVFFSVMLFGATLSVARLYDDPLLTPAALLRTEPGGGMTGVVGLFIGKDDDRYWLGAVTARCNEDGTPVRLVRGSGRIFTVPADQVVDVQVGALGRAIVPRHDRGDESPATEASEAEEDRDAGTAGDRALDLLQELARRHSSGGIADDAAAVPRALAVTGSCLRPPPRLDRLTPRAAAPARQVTITGADFDGDEELAVLIDGEPVQARGWDARSVRFDAPAGPPRTVRVQVRAGYRESNSLALAIRPAPPG